MARIPFSKRLTVILGPVDRWAVALMLVFALYMSLTCSFDLNIYDEGISLYGAVRVLDGELPYQDFWTVYPPGVFYLLAGLFRLFGVSLLAERILYVVIHILIAVLVYRLTARLSTARAGLLALCAVALWIGTVPLHGSRIYPALLLALSSCLCLVNYLDHRRRIWSVLAGLAVGGTTLFRHDFGLYALLSGGLVLLLFALRRTEDRRESGRNGIFSSMAGECIPFAGAVAMVLLPVILLLWSEVGAHALVQDLIRFPGTVLHEYRALPYPSIIPAAGRDGLADPTVWWLIRGLLERLLYYIPLVYVPAIIGVVVGLRREGLSARRLGSLNLVLLGLGLFLYARYRPGGLGHLTPTNILALCVLFSELARSWRAVRTGLCGRLRWVFAAFALTCAACLAQAFGMRAMGLLEASQRGSYVSMGLDRARGIRVREPLGGFLEEAVRYVQQHVPPDEKIFVGNPRHDNILINNVIFYFLAARHVAGKYHELHPGVATTRPVQEEIIESLKEHSVEHVVIVGIPESKEPNASSISSNVVLLDQHLRAKFSPVARFGPYLVARRTASR